MNCIASYHETIGTLPHHGSQSVIKLVGAPHPRNSEGHAQRCRCSAYLFGVDPVGSIVRVKQQGHAQQGRNGFPVRTTSPTPIITMGIVVVTALAAMLDGVP